MIAPPNTMTDLTRGLTKACEDMNAMMTNYVSAANKSNAAAWQGLEDMTCNWGALMQESLARTIAACTTLASAKSPQEAAERHADFLKDSFDSAVANGGKLSEISIRTAQSAMDPLAQHANDAIGTAMKNTKSA